MKRKSFEGELLKADSATGEVVAVFSRFNVVDRDRDVTLPGAFEDGAPVRVSAYNHGSSAGQQLPVGKGVLSQDSDVAMATMQFFMGTVSGRETFEVVKAMSEAPNLQEWSYNYDILDASSGVWPSSDGSATQNVQLLKKLHVHEVSPVLVGAGVDTQTVSVKSVSEMSDAELLAECERIFKAAKEKGLTIPEFIVTEVRERDSQDNARSEVTRLATMIAARHGIEIPNEKDDE